MNFAKLAVAGTFLALAACGGQGDDTLAEAAQEQTENRADAMEANGTATPAQAEAMRESGEAKEEAIDNADVNADAMTTEQQNAVVNSN